MVTMTASEARANFAATLSRVVDDAEPVVVTRASHEPVVIVSQREYDALVATAYLLRSPANARRLLASIDRLEAGQGQIHELVEEK